MNTELIFLIWKDGFIYKETALALYVKPEEIPENNSSDTNCSDSWLWRIW